MPKGHFEVANFVPLRENLEIDSLPSGARTPLGKSLNPEVGGLPGLKKAAPLEPF